MVGRLTARERREANERPSSFLPARGPNVPHPRARIPDHIRTRPEIYLPNGRTYFQRRLPPLINPSRLPPATGHEEAYDDRDIVPAEHTPPPDATRHQRKRISQARRWQLETLPKVMPFLARVLYKTKSLRHSDKLASPPTSMNCACEKAKAHKVAIVRFSCVEDLQMRICACSPAAVQLMQFGAFPCAPILPSLAVDLRVLEFARNLFLQVAPNNTAFSTTLERCLGGMGFQLQHQNSLRRRFGNCLLWYIHLRSEFKAHYGKLVEAARIEHLGLPESPPADERTPPPTPPRAATPEDNRATSPSPAERGRTSTTPPPSPRQHGRKRRREETPPVVPSPFPEPPPRTRASEYLRRRCPACFGNLKRDPAMLVDFCACIDACFTQKRRKARGQGGRDPSRHHPDSHWVHEEDAAKTEAYVDDVRNRKLEDERREKRHRAMRNALAEEPQDGYEHPLLRLPTSVLDACESSFKAADEKREKASTQFFEDTAIMGLLCRHDRVLWLVNMHSAGEKQFNVIALIEQLFQEIPLDVRVGLLYDVICGLERSCRKWGFLDRYMDRLEFAVSVFHAFGHEWACQVVFHPRKRVGFGFTNGEGCERFWHSISHLIANLRVCGHHNRLYTLDLQIEHADDGSLSRLAEWIRRRHFHSVDKRKEAHKLLVESGKSMRLLREQWALQVAAQTKPLPRRSKTKGQQAVNSVLLMRSALKVRNFELGKLRDTFLEAVEDDDESAPIHEVAFRSATEAYKAAERKLRQKESALGVEEKQSLNGLVNSRYMRLRMNARALKRRLRDRLRARKFELDRVERSFRRLVNDQKLYTHTESAVKRREPTISKVNTEYNKLCVEISTLIRDGKAPRGSVAPVQIPAKGIWQLDVDDAVWQDVGLDEDEDAITEPPPWLSDEKVRSGIRAMLELDRCDEEDARLRRERCSLQVWFAEEWTVVNIALDNAESSSDKYQLQLRRDELVRLCATWERRLPNLGVDESTLPMWGPSAAQIAACVVDAHAPARGDDRHYDSDEEEDDEESVGEESGGEDGDFGILDAVETADMYRGAEDDYYYVY
ncbi:hypothetical protein B0H15DRAFT_793346 [Mycena belliarum]|uniref:CxC1-like cysteine cluster associated with KDZ transposases domain-containing protein n=1 Tax=Mycena belliarum TaxID=1033014 RepID=A0AAD6TND5_9AGAR|nr:hypothetical protein B0H15DRAFT_793346 [Mycena belliae]